MEIIRSLKELRRDPDNVITVGTFDGVHRGHRFIIQELKRFAEQWQGRAVVVTFDPHPQIVLAGKDRPPIHILTTTEQKLALLEKLGVEKTIVIPFTREFSRMSSEDYVQDILYNTIGLKGIVIGYDHAFGRDRQGSIDTLKTFARIKGFQVEQLPPLEIQGQIISSTLIRKKIAAGEVEKANRCLDYAYTIRGMVIRGEGRGRQLGFPTANIELENPYQLIPADGVYVVTVKLPSGLYQGMANIGFRPTFNGRHRSVEVHILDFDADIYDERLEMSFYKRIRAEQKFTSLHALIQQLEKDREATRTYFSEKTLSV